MKITEVKESYGRNARNLSHQTHVAGLTGAKACLETFYHAFNNRDLEVFDQIWLYDADIQLNNPVGGMLRGMQAVRQLYERLFSGSAEVWVELSGILCYESDQLVVFAGMERGALKQYGEAVDLQIRTSRVFAFSEHSQRWQQLHHHGSIDNADMLQRYQTAAGFSA